MHAGRCLLYLQDPAIPSQEKPHNKNAIWEIVVDRFMKLAPYLPSFRRNKGGE